MASAFLVGLGLATSAFLVSGHMSPGLDSINYLPSVHRAVPVMLRYNVIEEV